tara:strand:+ start:1513 stop:1698 length:186 start_codon:yes stop_codon:yes gene_type:complete
MGKRKWYKVGELVKFNFAGSAEQGKVVEVDKEGKLTIFDGRYKYPALPKDVIKVVKKNDNL